MKLADKVTDMKETDSGVSVTVEGEEIKMDKMEAMASMCGPEHEGCKDDCCDDDFAERLKDISVKGTDGNVTMHLKGKIKAAEVANNLSRCNCYEP